MNYLAKKNNTLNGFSLVEIAIAIVVIALIAIGIAASSNFRMQTKLQKDIALIEKYKLAYSLFRSQYNAVPGDMINAKYYWQNATENGSGNNLIDTNFEKALAWQHLALAKLIEGSFNGASDMPHPFISNDKSVIYSMLAHSTAMWGIAGNSSNSLNIMGKNWNVLNTQQAFAIDTKIDDGIPTRGKVTAFSEPANDCVIQADGTSADYNIYLGIGSYNLKTARLCAITVWLSRQ